MDVDLGDLARRFAGETKPFFLTSEFLIWFVTVVGVLIAGLTDDDVQANLVWTLVVAASFAYVVSRGIAKSGTKYTGPPR